MLFCQMQVHSHVVFGQAPWFQVFMKGGSHSVNKLHGETVHHEGVESLLYKNQL